MEDRKELYINGMTNIDDVINMIKDNIDRGDIERDLQRRQKELQMGFEGCRSCVGSDTLDKGIHLL